MATNYHEAKAYLDKWQLDWDTYLDRQIDALELGCITFVQFLNTEEKHIKEAQSFGMALFRAAFYTALTFVPGAAVLGKDWGLFVAKLSEQDKKWRALALKTGFDFSKELHKQMGNASGKTDEPVDTGFHTINSFIYKGLKTVYSKEETIIDIYNTTNMFIARLKDLNIEVADYIGIVKDVTRSFKPPTNSATSAALYQALLYALIREWMHRHRVTVRMIAFVKRNEISKKTPIKDFSDTPGHDAVHGLNSQQLKIIFSTFGSNSDLHEFALERQQQQVSVAMKCAMSKASKLRKKGKAIGMVETARVMNRCIVKHVRQTPTRPIDKLEDLKHLGATIITTYFGSVTGRDSPLRDRMRR